MEEEITWKLPKWATGLLAAAVLGIASAGWIEACALRDDLQSLRIEWDATKGITGQQDLDRRLIRLEEWRRDVERFQGEGGRCTQEVCQDLRERIYALDKRLTRLE